MVLSGSLATVLAFAAALAATWGVLHNAARLGLIQAPNPRSSHLIPTPTGGGIGIVLGSVVAGAAASIIAPWPAILVAILAVCVGVVGLWDDIRPVRWQIRLGAQFVLFGVIAFALLPPLLAIPALVGGVLFINIFNFMDGIDGLAGSEAAFIFLASALLLSDGSPQMWWLLGLGAACLGFLVFNFPPARIFMGDVGSTALGLLIAALALVTVNTLTIWVWLILPALFISDGLVTLTRRLLQGERLFEAHRRHAYQLLARRYGSHLVVTLGALVVNVIWLLPLAWFARGNPYAALLTLAAYAPLVAGALIAGAGRRQPGEV